MSSSKICKTVYNPESRREVIVNGRAIKSLLIKYAYDLQTNILILHNKEENPILNKAYWIFNESDSDEIAREMVAERKKYGVEKEIFKNVYLELYGFIEKN